MTLRRIDSLVGLFLSKTDISHCFSNKILRFQRTDLADSRVDEKIMTIVVETRDDIWSILNQCSIPRCAFAQRYLCLLAFSDVFDASLETNYVSIPILYNS